MIEIKNICKYYKKGKVMANNNISLSIKRGDFLALIGLNGAGKTTLIKMLTGVLLPTSGTIIIDGKNYDSYEKEIKKNLGVVLGGGEHALYGKLTGMENMVFFGSFYNMNKRTIQKKAENIFKKLGLYEKKDDLVETYSMGMRQKLLVAKALLHDPEILILDEPCNGIDVVTNLEIKKILKELNQSGKTIILTTHNLNDAEDLCNTVCILQKGNVIASGTFKDVYKTYYSEKNIELIVKEKLNDIFFENMKNDSTLKNVFSSECESGIKYNILFDADDENVIGKIVKEISSSNLKSISEKKITLEYYIRNIIGE